MPRPSILAEMTQRSSDSRLGMAHEDGAHSQRDQRVALLGRTSRAIREARLSAADESVRATAADAEMTALENEALREAERDALRALEAEVRRFASRLRSEGTPPEIAVRRLKATVEPVVFAARDHDGGDVDWRRAVVGDVVRWFVEAYYAA